MKKRLFITSALMTAVMAASLATGTFAWYSTTSAGGITANKTSSNIATKNDATLGAAELTSTFSSLVPVELTDTDGNTYVYNGDNLTLASNQGDLTKFGTGTVTITNKGIDLNVMKGYTGTYDVIVKSSDRVRVSSSQGAVYSTATGTEVDIGDLVIDAGGNIVSDTNANVFTFYYSVAPKKDESNNDVQENYNSEATFGNITVSIKAQ